MTVQSQAALPFATRLWFAYVAFFKILFDGVFAARVREATQLPAGRAPLASLPERSVSSVSDDTTTKTETAPPAPVVAPVPPPPPAAPNHDAALALLSLFQREGRLVDFLEQEIAGFGDADIGAAVRVVHEGCRRALRAHVTIEPVRTEEEGARVTIAEAVPEEITLTGNVGGKGPYTGTLRHRGWKATSLSLPEAASGHDAKLLAAAEVEL